MIKDPIICGCNDIHKSTFAAAIREKGLRTTDQVTKSFIWIKPAEAAPKKCGKY